MSVSYSEWQSPGGTLTKLELVFTDERRNRTDARAGENYITKSQLEKLRLECREVVGRYFDNRILNLKDKEKE